MNAQHYVLVPTEATLALDFDISLAQLPTWCHRQQKSDLLQEEVHTACDLITGTK